MSDKENLMTLTADIVAAHVGNNNVSVSDVPTLIEKVYASLAGIGQGPAEAPAEEQKPAVSIRSSVKPDYIVCLEDGAKLTMLKRYLRTRFDMTPEQYRAKWGLPKDYPMVAPNYAEKRRSLAHSIGLGRKKGESPKAAVKAKGGNPPKTRGRKPKALDEALNAAKEHLVGSQDSEA